MSEFKWDLKRPCKHCPFANTEHRITFRGRERAAEIEETAYRDGFVCHLTGEDVELDEGESYIGAKQDGTSQHCAGALLMFLRGGGGNVPFEWLDEDEQDRIQNRLDWTALTFESSEDFINANAGDNEDD